MTDEWGAPPQQQDPWAAQPTQDPWAGRQVPPQDVPSVGDLLAGGSGPGGPAFKFAWDDQRSVGNAVIGRVLGARPVPKTDPGEATPKRDRNGKVLYQIAVAVQTGLRGWAGCKPPKRQHPDGTVSLANPAEDDGVRTLYLWYTLRDAVAEAMTKAGANLAEGIPNDSIIGVKVIGADPNPKGGEKIRRYEAVYYAPGAAPAQIVARIDAAPPVQQQAPPVQQPAPQQAPPQYAPVQQQQAYYAPPAQQAPPQGIPNGAGQEEPPF